MDRKAKGFLNAEVHRLKARPDYSEHLCKEHQGTKFQSNFKVFESAFSLIVKDSLLENKIQTFQAVDYS